MGEFVVVDKFTDSHGCSVLKDEKVGSVQSVSKWMCQEPPAWDLGVEWALSVSGQIVKYILEHSSSPYRTEWPVQPTPSVL